MGLTPPGLRALPPESRRGVLLSTPPRCPPPQAGSSPAARGEAALVSTLGLQGSANAGDRAARGAWAAAFAALKPVLELCSRLLFSRDDPCSTHEASLWPDKDCGLAVCSRRTEDDRGFSFDITPTSKRIGTWIEPLRWWPKKRPRRDPSRTSYEQEATEKAQPDHGCLQALAMSYAPQPCWWSTCH